MDGNRLKMNPTKTKVLCVGTLGTLHHCALQELNINGELIQRTPRAKYLGVIIDEHLKMDQQITTKCRIAMLNLHQIKLLRQSLTMSLCKTLIQALVIAHLGNTYSAYIGIPDNQLMKLQRVQNIAVTITLNHKMHDSATDCLITLHWFPCKFHIIFKAMYLVYKGLNGLAPKYIGDMFHVRASK